MITIDLGTIEKYTDEDGFTYEHGGVVRFEYSLKSVYEWEGVWKKPFLRSELTEEESIDFYMRMALDPMDKRFMTYEVAKRLREYIKDPQTATTFSSDRQDSKVKGVSKKATFHTAEDIYVRMISAGIPLEFENRNLNRLMTMLRVVSHYNEPPKKMSKEDILKQNASLNEQRKAMLKTKG